MDQLKVFDYYDNEVRTVIVDNEPYFVGKDVAEILGYKNVRDALSNHVDDEDKGVAKLDTLGGKQNLIIINESGVYSLVFGSKLPGAKQFKRWVTKEVLPSIRKTGLFKITDNPMKALELMFSAQKNTDKKVDELNDDFQYFKKDLPLLPVECDDVQKAVRQLGTRLLDGHGSPAYCDKSIRQRVYSDIGCEIKHKFNVRSYKAIKRKYLDDVNRIIEHYECPIELLELIKEKNRVEES